MPASRKLKSDDARTLLTTASTLIAAKGRNVVRYDVSGGVQDEAVMAMLGPTGNLRAPTIRTGNTLLVGFDEAAYREVFD